MERQSMVLPKYFGRTNSNQPHRSLALAAALLAFLGLPSTSLQAQVLYGVSLASRDLLTIDTQTSATTTVGPVGVFDLSGLAYDRDTDRLLGVSYDNYLYSINRTSGAATLVGPLGGGPQLVQFPGLGYDSTSHTLYLSTSPFSDAGVYKSSLYRVNTLTGAATKVADFPGNTIVDSLAYNPNAHVMYGVSSATDKIYEVNTTTAALREIADINWPFLIYTGAAYDAASDKLYWTDAGRSALYFRNMSTGESGLIGVSAGLMEVRGLAFTPVPEPSVAVLAAVGVSAVLVRRRNQAGRTLLRTRHAQ